MAAPADLTDQIVGNYRLVRKIGQGGMGAVYEAVHTRIGKRAAIKLLLPSEATEPGVIERFFNEACTVNAVQHPSIVNIYEHGHSDGGAPFLVMDFLDGETLRRRLERNNGRLQNEVLLIARQISAAMAAAHDKGVIHRDLKPDNIMLVHDPESVGGKRVKILDFGIAKLASGYAGHKAHSSQATGTGQAIGTPIYMSPEQCRGVSDLTGKTDVYAVGVMMYQMVAGRPPFVSQAAGELWGMHIYETPAPLQQHYPSVSPTLAALIHRMLAKAPDARPAMSEVTRELEALGAPRASLPIRTIDQPPPVVVAELDAPMASTLGSAASQISRPRRRRALGLVGGGALLGGGVILAGVLSRGPTPPTTPSAAPVAPAVIFRINPPVAPRPADTAPSAPAKASPSDPVLEPPRKEAPAPLGSSAKGGRRSKSRPGPGKHLDPAVLPAKPAPLGDHAAVAAPDNRGAAAAPAIVKPEAQPRPARRAPADDDMADLEKGK